ncbi:MAG: hypothetical protein ACTSO9_04010 [Candidatus Helarchaeota archaeon]
MENTTLKIIRILLSFVIFSVILYYTLDLLFDPFPNPFHSGPNIVIIVILSLILVALWIPELIDIIWFRH